MLVNSAGLATGGALSDGDADGLSDMLAVNVTALTRLSAVAAQQFVQRGQGAIINLASAMALLDVPQAAAYAASKAYVLNLTLSLDLDLKSKGVRVQAVLPGYTATAMIAERSDIPAQYIMQAEEMVDAALAGFDAGELVTIPSLPEPADYRSLLRRLAADAGVAPAAEVRGGDAPIELVRRRGVDASYLFVVNHGVEPVTVSTTGFEIVTGMPVAGDAVVPGGAVRIIREEAAA